MLSKTSRLIAEVEPTINLIYPIFGDVKPPVSSIPEDPLVAIPKLVGTGINLFLLLAGVMVLIYLLWGAYDWIVSGGNKEAIVKAQNKIMNAVIGIVVVVAAITIFTVVTGNILGIINFSDGWKFNIPHL
ncbi:hypothetical protein COT62_01070 [Candidatus Roizmanbacteria bacterium CG09_land_8_20_14_0_10_41_9]|uniref:Uncharacterized protein n=1 Tax=Candidatus Roizmanbacteria bacterium CG09_land_8_20_14_0_10_41_9 TaxID=1974850 RepID=A0A2H0WTI9_9BACT|nr:MAG: hypothetical protein COT62_01070 [Candidatus Roizmanbacteria bacterium CG09_land_8_20_14_0_10_41_9]